MEGIWRVRRDRIYSYCVPHYVTSMVMNLRVLPAYRTSISPPRTQSFALTLCVK